MRRTRRTEGKPGASIAAKSVMRVVNTEARSGILARITATTFAAARTAGMQDANTVVKFAVHDVITATTSVNRAAITAMTFAEAGTTVASAEAGPSAAGMRGAVETTEIRCDITTETAASFAGTKNTDTLNPKAAFYVKRGLF